MSKQRRMNRRQRVLWRAYLATLSDNEIQALIGGLNAQTGKFSQQYLDSLLTPQFLSLHKTLNSMGFYDDVSPRC